MRNFESSAPTIEEELPEGIEAEKGMSDFLAENFSCVRAITQNRSEIDDKNGIDMLAEIEYEDNVHQLAIEVSGPDPERRREKAERQWRTPVVSLHNQNGKPVGDLVPRILIGYNVGYFLSRQKEAEIQGKQISEVMSDKEKHDLKTGILSEILNQIDILATDREYFKRIKNIRKAFEEEKADLEELGI